MLKSLCPYEYFITKKKYKEKKKNKNKKNKKSQNLMWL
jgi:hypothetical protein